MSTRSEKAVYWLKLLSKFVSVQLIVQAINLFSGILIIRTISKQEYAFFVIANAMQATMNTLSDSGLGSALSAIGGRVWQDPYRFGQLINTAMQCRKYLATIAILVVTPILFWILLSNRASIEHTILLTLAILIELSFYLSAGVLRIVLQLHSQIDRVQKLDLIFACSRIILLIFACMTFLNSVVAAFASTIASGIHNFFLRRWVKDNIDIQATINKNDRQEIFNIVKPQVANAIFFSIQGQLTVWLVSFFGNTSNIAEVGALGRIVVIFSIANSVVINILLPSFARNQSSIDSLNRQYWQILGFCCLCGAVLICLAIFLPSQILWILGNKYANLQFELLLMTIGCAFNFIIGGMWGMNSSRGWVDYSWLYIPSTVITQIILITFLDIGNLKGVLFFNILSCIPNFFINAILSFRGFSKIS